MLFREILSIVFPPVKNLAGFDIFGGVVYQRCSRAYLSACLIFAVEFVNILNELTVEQVKRDVLGANSGAFATVGAASCYVESSDDVEELFFKAVSRRFVFNARGGVVKYAFFASASRASVTASVATDATGEFILPESKSFVSSHSLKTSNLVKTSRFYNVTVFAHEFIISDVLFTLAVDAAFSKNACGFDGNGSVVVKGGDNDLVAFGSDRSDAFAADRLNLGDISHTFAGNTYGIYLFTVETVFGEKLIEAVSVARL